MKTLSTLLAQRQAILRQAYWANLAFAFDTLRTFAQRIERARLNGTVHLAQAAPESDRYWASLTAIDFSQAIVEEHFTDEDVMTLADTVAFLSDTAPLEVTFRLEEFAETFLTPLQAALDREGIRIDRAATPSDAVH